MHHVSMISHLLSFGAAERGFVSSAVAVLAWAEVRVPRWHRGVGGVGSGADGAGARCCGRAAARVRAREETPRAAESRGVCFAAHSAERESVSLAILPVKLH